MQTQAPGNTTQPTNIPLPPQGYEAFERTLLSSTQFHEAVKTIARTEVNENLAGRELISSTEAQRLRDREKNRTRDYLIVGGVAMVGGILIKTGIDRLRRGPQQTEAMEIDADEVNVGGRR